MAKVKELRKIGDITEYEVQLDGKKYVRCHDQYFISVRNSRQAPAPFWRVHHGQKVHAKIDAAILEFESK